MTTPSCQLAVLGQKVSGSDSFYLTYLGYFRHARRRPRFCETWGYLRMSGPALMVGDRMAQDTPYCGGVQRTCPDVP
jgi:hypothetical protein